MADDVLIFLGALGSLGVMGALLVTILVVDRWVARPVRVIMPGVVGIDVAGLPDPPAPLVSFAPAPPGPWQVGHGWDPGRQRAENQDRLGITDPAQVAQPRGALYLVADGLGGHAAGAVASQIAVDQIRFAYYGDPGADLTDSLVRAVEMANAAIYRQAQENPAQRGLGSTVVAAALRPETIRLAWVGDSRAYRVRGGRIECLTHDHSWVQELVDRGDLTPEEALRHDRRNVLTRSLGGLPAVEVDVRQESVQPGDVFVLCSDGLHGMVADRLILYYVQTAPDPQAAADHLVALANQAGGPDNIAVIVLAQPCA